MLSSSSWFSLKFSLKLSCALVAFKTLWNHLGKLLTLKTLKLKLISQIQPHTTQTNRLSLSKGSSRSLPKKRDTRPEVNKAKPKGWFKYSL